MTNHFNEMAKYFDSLSQRHDLSTVFNDFLTMAVCAFHKTNIQSCLKEQDAENEALYIQTIKKYEKEEINTFPKILGEVQCFIIEKPYSDPFGDYFMEHLSNGKSGQFFTSEPICHLMSHMSSCNTVTGKTVFDPTCGSGRTLLSFARLNPDNFFYGADISASCARMSALNFFLNGLRGEVAWMDSLALEWFGGWQINMQGLGIMPIEKEQSRIWSAPSLKPNPPDFPSEDLNAQKPIQIIQLDLF